MNYQLSPELFFEPALRHNGEKLVQGHQLKGVIDVLAQVKEDQLDVQFLGFSQYLDQGRYGGGVDADQVFAVYGDHIRLFGKDIGEDDFHLLYIAEVPFADSGYYYFSALFYVADIFHDLTVCI